MAKTTSKCFSHDAQFTTSACQMAETSSQQASQPGEPSGPVVFLTEALASPRPFVATNSGQEVSENDTTSDDVCLFVSSKTWTRDSHDLFDYEAGDVEKKSYFLRVSSRIFRSAHDVQIIPEGTSLPCHPADYLLSVRQRDGRYLISPAEKTLQSSVTFTSKRVWLIVKELPQGYHHLQESDVIKLGRYKLRVKNLVRSGPSTLELRLDDVETPHSIVTPKEAVTMQCRICLLDGGSAEDPLLCPCQCRGSIKFVHVECLRQWINGRLALTGNMESKAFFLKQLQCELCKTPFPSTVILNGERVRLVSIPRIEAPFIILETMGGPNRGLHVVSMEERKELKLGRGHESDMRIPDVSISRYHATIRFIDGKFTLEDHNSKFGTLVALRKIQQVELAHPLAVQVGRTILNFSLRKPSQHIEEFQCVSDVPAQITSETDVNLLTFPPVIQEDCSLIESLINRTNSVPCVSRDLQCPPQQEQL